MWFITSVKIRDCRFSMKYYYGFGTRVNSLLYEIRVQEKPQCCNRASECYRQQWHKEDLWLLGRCGVETKTENRWLEKENWFTLLNSKESALPPIMSQLASCSFPMAAAA